MNSSPYEASDSNCSNDEHQAEQTETVCLCSSGDAVHREEAAESPVSTSLRVVQQHPVGLSLSVTTPPLPLTWFGLVMRSETGSVCGLSQSEAEEGGL